MGWLGLLAVLVMTTAARSDSTKVLASCGGVRGYAYYPDNGSLLPDDAGWTEDAITRGSSTLVRSIDGKLDLLFTDATETPVSARADGGEVLLLRRTESEAVVMVAYPRVVELYHYVREPGGRLLVMHLQSKSSLISKTALMVGSCSALPLLTEPLD